MRVQKEATCLSSLQATARCLFFATATTFIFCQSYGNSFPQSKQTTYVVEPSPCFLAVLGNVQWR